MKSPKLIYLLTALIAVLFLALPSTSMALEKPSVELLKENHSYLRFSRKTNQATVLALELCLCQALPDSSPMKASCNNNNEISSFTRRFYISDLKVAEQSLACNELIDNLLKNPIKENFNNMRLDLALSKAPFREEVMMAEYGPHNAFKFSQKISHPFYSWFTGIPIQSLPSLTQDEAARALIAFNQSRDKMCRAYFLSLSKSEEEKIQDKKICEQLALHGFRSLSFEDQNSARYMSFRLRLMREDYRKSKLDAYMLKIAQAPILLMVKSAQPSDEELLTVVRAQKEFKGNVTSALDVLEKVKSPNEEQLFSLAYQAKIIPDRVVALLKQKHSEKSQINWDLVQQSMQNKINDVQRLEQGIKYAASATVVTACAFFGPQAATGCAFTIATLAAGQFIGDYVEYTNTLLDFASYVDRDLVVNDTPEESLMDQLSSLETSKLTAVLFAVPMLRSLPKAKAVKAIQEIL